MTANYESSFEKIHEINGKSTPTQITAYHTSLHLHKVLNPVEHRLENVTVLNQMTCAGRHTMFFIFRDNNNKVGLNTTANKLYNFSGKIACNSLNYSFVQFENLMYASKPG